jgi:thioredoxin 1
MGKFQDVIKSDTPTLVDFYATWCGPCQAMMPTIDQLKAKKGSSLRVLKIDVDKNAEVAAKYKIKSVPTLILFKKGEIVWRQAGGMDLKTLMSRTAV